MRCSANDTDRRTVNFDPRLTPARTDLAAKHLEGKVEAERFVEGTLCEVVDATAPVRREPRPDAPQETQALKGERVTVYEITEEGWCWGQLEADGYVGWIPANAMSKPGADANYKVDGAQHAGLSGAEYQGAADRDLAVRRACCDDTDRGAFRRHGLWRLHSGATPCAHRYVRERFRRRGRALSRHALSVGRQEPSRHRLFRPCADGGDRLRHYMSARQRHAAGFARRRGQSERRACRCRNVAMRSSGPAMSPSCATARPSSTPTPITWRWRSNRLIRPSPASRPAGSR